MDFPWKKRWAVELFCGRGNGDGPLRPPEEEGTGRSEKFGRATARSHSRLSKFSRNKELFPIHERKRVVFRIFSQLPGTTATSGPSEGFVACGLGTVEPVPNGQKGTARCVHGEDVR